MTKQRSQDPLVAETMRLPSGWKETTLGELGTFFRGHGGTREDEIPHGMPCVRYGDLYTHHDFIIRSFASFIRPASVSDYFPLRPGDVVFAGSGETFEEIGKAAVYCDQAPAFAGGDTIIFRPSAQLDPYFAGYAVNGLIANSHKSRHGQGSSVIHIGAGHLAGLPIKLPPLGVQQRLAHYLQTIDQAIEKTEALIKKYQQIKAGLMHDLFTRGIGPDGKLRPPREQAPELYQETPIGWIPKEWSLVPLGDLFAIQSGITLGPHRRPKKNAKPYLRVANVYKESLDLEDIAYLEATDVERETYGLKTLDLLVVEGHANIKEIGRCAIIDQDAEGLLYQNHLFRLRAARIEPYFAMYLLNSDFARKYWEQHCSTSSGLNTINKTLLRRMMLCIPSKSEQQKLERRMASAANAIWKEGKALYKLHSCKAGLMHDLLTGKVPVNPDPPEPTNA